MGGSYPYRWLEPDEPEKPKNPSPQEDALLRSYGGIRLDVVEIEELLSSPSDDWSDEDLKRLDKAVTVIKAGAKIVKKVLKAHGARTKEMKESALARARGDLAEVVGGQHDPL